MQLVVVCIVEWLETIKYIITCFGLLSAEHLSTDQNRNEDWTEFFPFWINNSIIILKSCSIFHPWVEWMFSVAFSSCLLIGATKWLGIFMQSIAQSRFSLLDQSYSSDIFLYFTRMLTDRSFEDDDFVFRLPRLICSEGGRRFFSSVLLFRWQMMNDLEHQCFGEPKYDKTPKQKGNWNEKNNKKEISKTILCCARLVLLCECVRNICLIEWEWACEWEMRMLRSSICYVYK